MLPPRLLKEMRSKLPKEKKVKPHLVSEEVNERSDFLNLLCSDQHIRSKSESARELSVTDKCD